MPLDPELYWYCVIKDYSTARDTERNREYRDHEYNSGLSNDQYVSTESEFEKFVNEDVTDQIEEVYEGLREKDHEDTYQGYNLPDIDDFSLDTNNRKNEDIFDSYLGAGILLPDHDGDKKMAKVIKQVKYTMVIKWGHNTINLC